MSHPDPTTPDRCSECGTPADRRRAPLPPGVLHWTRLWPLVALIVAGAIVVTMTARTVRTIDWTYSRDFSRGMRFLDPPLAVPDLRRAAAGEPVAVVAPLLARANDWLVAPPRPDRIQIEIHDARGRRRVDRAAGRPVPWVRWSETVFETSVVTREPLPIPAATPIRRGVPVPVETQWRFEASTGLLVATLPPLPVGQPIRTMTVNIAAIATALLLLAAVAWLARRVPRGGLLVALAVLALLGWSAVTVRRSETVTALARPLGVTPDAPPPEGATVFDADELRALAAAPDGDRRAAAAILARAGAVEGLLATTTVEGTAARHEERRIGWPLRMYTVQRTERSTGHPRRRSFDAERVRWPPGALRVGVRGGRLVAVLPRPHGTARMRVVHVHPTGLAGTAFALIVLWGLVRAACLGCRALAGRRRVRRGRCVACGYPLAPG